MRISEEYYDRLRDENDRLREENRRAYRLVAILIDRLGGETTVTDATMIEAEHLLCVEHITADSVTFCVKEGEK